MNQMNKEQVIEAIRNLTNDSWLHGVYTSTRMGWQQQYDFLGRPLHPDPNYKHCSANIEGTDYSWTKVGWTVYIWKPEYASEASYGWVWKEDKDEYLLAVVDLTPEYVKEYYERKKAIKEQNNSDLTVTDLSPTELNVVAL